MTTPARRSYADGADEVIDLDGKLVTPAFVDAHVHTAQTGALLTGLDLAGTTVADRSAGPARRVRADAAGGRGGRRRRLGRDEVARGPPADGGGAGPCGRRPPGVPVAGRRSLRRRLVRAGRRSAAAATGYDAERPRGARRAPRGPGRARASSIGPEQRRTDIAAALKAMASKGIGAFHEMAAPHIGPLWDFRWFARSAEQLGLSATLYWGEPGVFEHIDDVRPRRSRR